MSCEQEGCGTVFELKRPTKTGGKWHFSLLHTFTGEPDGALPFAGVTLDQKGNLYGTTNSGGGTIGLWHCLLFNPSREERADLGLKLCFIPLIESEYRVEPRRPGNFRQRGQHVRDDGIWRRPQLPGWLRVRRSRMSFRLRPEKEESGAILPCMPSKGATTVSTPQVTWCSTAPEIFMAQPRPAEKRNGGTVYRLSPPEAAEHMD